MKIYIGFDSYQGAGEGACLIFANTAREAKKLAYPIIRGWFDTEWIETGVKMLRDMEYLKSQATSDLPHAIECPETCPKCELWGTGEIVNGSCPVCNDADL